MTVKKIVAKYLKDNRYDGLYIDVVDFMIKLNIMTKLNK